MQINDILYVFSIPTTNLAHTLSVLNHNANSCIAGTLVYKYLHAKLTLKCGKIW